jgi:DNA-binding NarL/FixJ family response regulator
VVKLLLIDEDAIFRLGLRTELAEIPDLQLVAEAASVEEVWELLENPFLVTSLDLVILDLEMGTVNFDPPVILYPQIQARYPELPLFLLASALDIDRLIAARQAGVRGYCRKGTSLERLSIAFREVAAGRIYWQTFPTQKNLLSTIENSEGDVISKRRSPQWLTDWQVRGLHYIDDDLDRITRQLKNLQLSQLDRLVLSGRRRELRVARWVVRQIFPLPEPQLAPSQNRLETIDDRPKLVPSISPVVVKSPDLRSSDIQTLQAILFDNTLAKLQSNLVNLSHETLELDIFRSDKKRELLYTVLREVENVLAELRFAEISPEQLAEKRLEILVDLWQSSTEIFFGKYYMLPLEGQQLEVVGILLQDVEIVRDSMLDKIPAVEELLAHLLYQTPLVVDNLPCNPGSVEGMRRAEHLLQNSIVRVANAVIQPLLEHFADVETIKQNFYDRCLLSTREIERFRNELSWKYRLQTYIGEPKAIYESRYGLLILDDRGIKKISIYASRRQELEALSGIQQTVTLVLEGRDAIAPRLRSAVTFVGSSLVYVLTQIIGRGLGLIARGVLDSISTVKLSNLSKNSKSKIQNSNIDEPE